MRILAVLLCAIGAYGQSTRVLNFRQIDATSQRSEVAKVISALTDKTLLSVDDAGDSLALHGTDQSIAVGEWLFRELDRNQLAPRDPRTPVDEFSVSGASGQTAAVFFPIHSRPPEDSVRIANVVRGISGVEHLISFAGGKAVAMSGTTDKINKAEWLLAHLERPADSAAQNSMVMRSNGNESVVTVLYASEQPGCPSLIEISRVIQSIADTPMAFPSNTPEALLVQASAERIELAAWLFHQLDQPPGDRQSTPHEYRLSNVQDNLVRIFYIPNAGDEAGLRDFANGRLRAATHVLRQQLVPTVNAIVMRGTPEQAQLAERLVLEKSTGIASPAAPAATGFQVASVKLSARPQDNPEERIHPDGLDFQNVPLIVYITSAYSLRFYQVVGPSWITTEKYDISAKTSAPVATGQLWPMLQPVLVERFHLTTHRETRMLDGYELIIAKRGLQIHPVEKASAPVVQRANTSQHKP